MSTNGLMYLNVVVVKVLERDDIDKVVPIYLEAFKDTTEADAAALWFSCNLGAYPQKICFGAWQGNILLGYIVWTERGGFRDEAVWELEQIAVEVNYRSQGIGTKLILDSLESIKSHITKRGATLKLIMVSTGVNNRALRLYERALGATKEAVIRDLYSGDELIMVTRLSVPNAASVISERGLLVLEYEQCQRGYDNRDQVIPRELNYIGVIFGVFTSALLLAVRFLDSYTWPFWIGYTIISVTGLLLLLSFLVDMLANISVRRALRNRSTEIEELLALDSGDIQTHTPLQIWRETIPKRKRSRIERFLKSMVLVRGVEKDADYFTWGGFLVILLWVSFLRLIDHPFSG